MALGSTAVGIAGEGADGAGEAGGDDEALAARAAGDAAAFGELFERYADPVLRYCRWRLGDAGEAEDAAAQVFARAWEALPRYRPGGFRAWLFAIAHNVVANRHRARRAEVCYGLEAAGEVADGGPSPEDLAVAAAGRDALGAALARLPADQRRVVELRLAGLTGPEIAAVLGRSHAAVKMLQLRAVDRLRGLLAPPGGNGEGRDAEG